MENKKRINAYIEDVKVLQINLYIGKEGEENINIYANQWLILSNLKREYKEEFLELNNFYNSDNVEVLIDIREFENEETALSHYTKYFEGWGMKINHTEIKHIKKYIIEEYELNEDNDIILILE